MLQSNPVPSVLSPMILLSTLILAGSFTGVSERLSEHMERERGERLGDRLGNRLERRRRSCPVLARHSGDRDRGDRGDRGVGDRGVGDRAVGDRGVGDRGVGDRGNGDLGDGDRVDCAEGTWRFLGKLIAAIPMSSLFLGSSMTFLCYRQCFCC